MADDTQPETSDRVVTPTHEPPAGAETAASWVGPDGATLDYTASAGWVVLRDGETPTAEVFSVSYVVAADDGGAGLRHRPVMFVFNGGPGAASAYLHVGVAGPRTVAFGEDGAILPAPAQVVDNPDSWLAVADLVFIDPVGTGFSRLLPAGDDEEREQDRYYRPKADLAAMGQFIARWLTDHGRWDAPVLLAGESYGGYRVGRMARTLQADVGVGLAGIVLISPALEIDALGGSDYDVLAWIDRLPTMALAALHHGRGRVSGDVEEVTAAALDFARGPYVRLLLRGAGLPDDERAATLALLGDLLGLDPAVVERHRGRVPVPVFARELLRDERRLLGIYDATVTTIDPFPDRDPSPGPDPTLVGLDHVFTTGANHVVRDWIGVSTQRDYVLLSMEVNAAWKPDEDTHALQLVDGASDDLRYGLSLNPHMQTLIVHGRHDLVTPWATTRRLLDLLHLDEGARGRIATAVYDGGHMFYTRAASRRSFTADVTALVERATRRDT